MPQRRGAFLGDESEIFSGSPESLVNLEGWSASGELTVGNTNKKFSLQAQFKQLGTHLIQFNAPNNDINTVKTEASIEWSVKGNSVKRLISVLDGASIQGTAEAVRIIVYDLTTGSARNYVVSTQIVPGGRASYQQPPTLRVNGSRSGSVLVFGYGIPLAAAESASWTIPADAGAISSYTTVATDAGVVPILDNEILIEQLAFSGSALKTYGKSGCFEWVPLYGGTKTIKVTNNSAVAITVGNTLGIEG